VGEYQKDVLKLLRVPVEPPWQPWVGEGGFRRLNGFILLIGCAAKYRRSGGSAFATATTVNGDSKEEQEEHIGKRVVSAVGE